MSNLAIYKPKWKALEYSEWACNFFVGCSNGCTYCYLKKGIGAKILGGCEPKLKAYFKSEKHALEIFEKELKENLTELQKHGLFFSFTTDPMLEETIKLTEIAIDIATDFGVPVKILTKRADWLDYLIPRLPINFHNLYAFGFTLTGYDELEPNASTNQERIEAMKELHEAGFKTFSSIEPIIDLRISFEMIAATNGFCDLYKVGLESGKKYDKHDLFSFITGVITQIEFSGAKVYFKESLLDRAEVWRSTLPANCVNRDFNLFK